MKTPITKSRIRHHFQYNGWKYLVLVAASIFGWNLIYTTTSYRPPEDKRINFYVSSSGTDSAAVDEYLAQLQQTVFPDMEEMTCVAMSSNDGADVYVNMQLSTYIMAGEGDVYLINRNDFSNYAQGGGMASLDEYLAAGVLSTQDLDLSFGYKAEDEAGETHLYGIPTDQLFGLMERFGIDNREMVLCVLVRSGNEENAVKFINQLILDMKQDPPEWLDQYNAYVGSQPQQ